MIVLNALAKVRGNDDLVIVQAVDMESAFCIFSDGSLGSFPLEDVKLTLIEVTARFNDIKEYNDSIISGAREHSYDD